MSRTSKQRFRCPDCGHLQGITIWEDINASEEPEVKRALLDGSLFAFKCKRCSHRTSLGYALLYYDVNVRLILCHIPVLSTGESALTEIKSMSGMNNNFTDMGFSLRIVRDLTALNEKIILFDNGRDDRIIEILKLLGEAMLPRLNPGFSSRGAVYEHNVNGECLCFLDAEEGSFRMPLDEENYAKAAKLLGEKRLSVGRGNYEVVDREWALSIVNSL